MFSVYNMRYRDQLSEVELAIKDNEDFRSLTFRRYGDGNVILLGNLTQQQVRSLEQDLVNRFGSLPAKFAVSEISIREE